MKVKLKSLGLPATSGYLLRASDISHSGTDYAVPTNKINELYYRETTGVIGGERLGTENDAWIPYVAFQTLVAIIRSDKLIIDLLITAQNLTIKSIIWQSGNTVRYTFNNSQDLHNIVLNIWYNFSGSVHSQNDGIYKVVAVGSNYLDVTNKNRSSSTNDESTSTAILTQILTEFEVVDIKREIHSQFEDHYQLTVYQQNV